MPIFEFRCNLCAKKFSRLIVSPKKNSKVSCPYCNSSNIDRIFSTFLVQQSEESRIANLDSANIRDLNFYKDPANIGLWAKKRTRELGVNLGPKFEEVVEKARTGKIFTD